jgi:hypothetical protein
MADRGCRLKHWFLVTLVTLCIVFPSETVFWTVSASEEVTVVTENTVLEGDLVVDGNEVLKVVSCAFNVNGTTILREQGKLLLVNATFDTNGLTLYDFSELKINSSTYSWGVKAYGYSTIKVTDSSFVSALRGQLVELSDASSISMYNSTSMNMLILLGGQADATVSGCGPAISIQTGTESNIVDIVDSMVPLLTVYGSSHVRAANSLLGEVVVAHDGVLVAESCFVTGSLGYYDYHAYVELRDCNVTTLIDGLIYRNVEASLEGEDIFLGNYTMGVENVNSEVADRRYVLFLLGEKGRYELADLTPKVVKVLIEASTVEARSMDEEDLAFFIGGNGYLTVEDSTFSWILAMTTSMLEVYNCHLQGIDFENDIISILRIVNSTVVPDEGPAISGGWATETLLESSLIDSPEGSSDIDIEYLNVIMLRNVSDIVLTGTMGVSVMVYDSDVTFSSIAFENVYNDLNRSETLFVDGAKYTVYTSRPADLIIRDLKVTPKRVSLGAVVSITLTVENVGGLSGTDYFELTLDGRVIDGLEVKLAGGESRELEYQLTGDELGSHSVELGGETGDFVVVDPNSPGEIVKRNWIWFTLLIVMIAGVIVGKRYLTK